MTIPRDGTELVDFMIAQIEAFDSFDAPEFAARILSALDAAGLVIVPREATQGMMDAGWWMIGPDDTPEIAYTKMLSVSPFSVTEDPQP